MDISAVHQLFFNTMAADLAVRQQAEDQLKQLDSSPDMLGLVLQLIDFNETLGNVKLAAAIYLKNRIRRDWESYEGKTTVTISPANQATIKSLILEVMSRAPENIRAILTSAIGTILIKDFPKAWPEFLPTVTLLVKSDNINLAYCGLLALHELFRVYQFKSSKKEAHFGQLIDNIFPRLNAVGLEMVSQDSNEAAIMVHLCLKMYYKGIRTALPKSQQEPATLISWGNLFIQVIEKAVPNQLLPEDAGEREVVPWVKTRKWGYHCLNSLFERYGNPASLDKNSKYYRFAQKFVKHFAPNILKAYLEQVDKAISGTSWLSRKCAFLTSMFFTECVHHKSTWNLLLPHTEKLITQFIYPQLCYSNEDEEEMEDNPSEFLHRRLMNSLDKVVDSEASIELLSCMVDRRKKHTFDGILAFASNIMSKHHGASGAACDREKDGALALIESVADVIVKSGETSQEKVAQFFIQFVFPELNSANPLLRYRACSMIHVYSDLDFSEPAVVEAFKGVVGCLGHPQLIVRVGSALALQGLVPYQCVSEFVVPLLPQITEQLLLLTTQIDMENLAQVLELLVEIFPTELAPYSVRLCESLIGTLHRLMKEITRTDENDLEDCTEEDTDKIFTAMGVLKTIGTIVISLDENRPTLEQLECLIIPTVKQIFVRRIDAIYVETFEAIDCCIYSMRAVSPMIWDLFETIYTIACEEDSTYLSEICTTFDNFVGFGTDRFIQEPDLQLKLLCLFGKTMADEHSMVDSRSSVCKLMLSMLLHFQTAAVNMVEPILQVTKTHLTKPQDTHGGSLPNHLIKLTVACFIIDAPLTIRFMESNEWTGAFFTLWLSKLSSFVGVHDKKLSITAICKILAYPHSFYPATIQSGWHDLLLAILENFKTLPEAIERYKEALKGCGEDSEDAKSSATREQDDDASDDENDVEDIDEGPEPEDSEASTCSELLDSDYSEDDALESDLSKSPLNKMDVYIIFQDIFHHIESSDPAGFSALIHGLTEEQHQAIQKVLQTATENRTNPPQAAE
ncbi:Nonsense-mediated mRNA decay protein 5 [Entomophthora muscae]|uniref:Nonsense-mediated mRNA decay protein 5 n=1 Tax=Entomophthora muscae TaxID=34485 RepID=A0ACC2RN99_9FUNG|nr:Nonsense-mediated mRNA decay protein 5 [Entomophthora muscae]